MSDGNLLIVGILVFSLLIIGVVISAMEFKRLEKEQTEPNTHVAKREK